MIARTGRENMTCPGKTGYVVTYQFLIQTCALITYDENKPLHPGSFKTGFT